MKKYSVLNLLVFSGLAMSLSSPVLAEIKRSGLDASPIAASVTIPPEATVVYLSGALARETNVRAPKGSLERYGNTETQTRSVLSQLAADLKTLGMGPEDVVMMRIYLVAPPGSDRMDFEGMMKAYLEMYGTPEQPKKPARATMQVAALVAPQFLVEIEVQAAKVMN